MINIYNITHYYVQVCIQQQWTIDGVNVHSTDHAQTLPLQAVYFPRFRMNFGGVSKVLGRGQYLLDNFR